MEYRHQKLVIEEAKKEKGIKLKKEVDDVLLDLKVDLLQKLGFEDWAHYEKEWNSIENPKKFPLF